VVIHDSIEGRWSFVNSYFCQGWIERQDIALAQDKAAVQDYCESTPFVIYTGESGYVYYDREKTRLALKMRMGTRLPLIEDAETYYCVRVPIHDANGYLSFAEGYLPKDSSAHSGYLPFTQENVARLAFGLKGSAYGWGGMFEGRDCSRFIFDIFRCMGMLFPRNSASQSQAGFSSIDLADLSIDQKERTVIEKGVPFATLLNLPGHVMLYIGEEGGKAYAIHNTWAYRENVFFKDRLRKIAQVVISDLHLGDGSKKGSFLDRLSSMTFLVDKELSRIQAPATCF
jgi:hypothetical protein